MAHAAEQQRARQDRRVLAVVLGEHSHSPDLERYMAETDVAELRVVAPTQVDALHWYATDEDEAHAEAEARAAVAEREIAPVAEVEGAAGERDPVLAVEDALSDFRADRILVVGDEDAAMDASLHRFGLPIEHLGETTPGGGLQETGRAIMSGRSSATPYAVFGGAMLVLATVVALLLLLAALILWV